MLTTKVLIADDHQVVAESLGILLDIVEGIEVVGIVNNGWQMLSFLEVNPVLAKLAEIPNANTHNGKEQPSEIGILSKREIEILRMIVQGQPNQAIADGLNLAVTTVETLRRNILKKVGANSTLGLMKYAIKHQLLAENA